MKSKKSKKTAKPRPSRKSPSKVTEAKAEPAAKKTPAKTKKPAAKKKSVRVAKTKAAIKKPGKQPQIPTITAKTEEVKPATLPESPSVEAKADFTKPATSKPAIPKLEVPKPNRSKPLTIPPILLEGDKPEASKASGPGERFALGPKARIETAGSGGELPESYGSQSLFLTARDPHWLYAHWDLSREQRRKYNGYSRDGHLVLRVYENAVGGKPAAEVNVQPESNHWFVNVGRGGTKYVAELGYYSAGDQWCIVSTSGATVTPPDKMSEDVSVEFTTVPLEVPLEKLLTLVKEAVQENPPLAQEIRELRAEHPKLPPMRHQEASEPPVGKANGMAAPQSSEPRTLQTKRETPPSWTPAQEKALAEVISMDSVRRVWMGSLEITELIRRQWLQELAVKAEAQLGGGKGGMPTSPAHAPGIREESGGAVSSPALKPSKPGKGFWFNVNAELIIYGATEADATVTIAGRTIKLRRDGSFSYRFALPDGNYELPVVAISADQTDGRAAELAFSRQTEYRGDVGHHPQDAALKKPVAESF